MMPSCVPVHERFERQVADAKKELPKLMVAVTADSAKEKRKASEKAATKMTEFTDFIEEDEVPLKKHRRINGELNNMVEKPRCTVKPPNRSRGLWKIELSKKGKAKCRHPGCNFLGDTMETMFEHDSRCSCAPRVNYWCKICNFSHESEEEVANHVRLKHPSEQSKTLKKDACLENKDHSSSSEYESEGSFDDSPQRSRLTLQ